MTRATHLLMLVAATAPTLGARPSIAHGWQPLESVPVPRSGHAAVYDSDRGVVVMFGGSSYSALFLAETWEWDGTRWRQREAGPAALLPRSKHAMAYDARRQRSVLFGGLEGFYGPALNDTWEFDGNAWAPGPTAPRGLAPRAGHAMCFDSARELAVLVGGYGDGGGLADTWEYDGTWRSAPVPPVELWDHAMAYDAARALTVVQIDQSTWEYDGTTWTAGVAGPPGTGPRRSNTLTYDPIRRISILVGRTYTNYLPAETWEYDGSSWVQGPDALWALEEHAAVFDAASGGVLAIGGDTYNHDTNELQIYDGAWERRGPPAPRTGHAMAFDASRGRVVLFGGDGPQTPSERSDTWEFDGSTWLPGPDAPPGLAPRYAHAMCYDAVRRTILMYGGQAYGSPDFADTWEYGGAAWTAGAAAPPEMGSRAGHSMSYDEARGRTVLFGGAGFRENDTWEHDGVGWVPGGPTPAALQEIAGQSMSYHAASARTVLFGGVTCDTSSCTWTSETWLYEGTTWSPGETAPSELIPRASASMAYDARRGRLVLYGGESGGAMYDDTWEYDGFDWGPGGMLPSSPLRTVGGAMVYDAPKDQMVLFGGSTTAYGLDNNTWSYGPTDRPAYVAALGAGPANPSRVALFELGGAPAGADLHAYGGGGWGARAASGRPNGGPRDVILTGPGPGHVLGPHVRGFDAAGQPLAKISFYAYGTLRYGVDVSGGNVDADGYDEIATGAGAGEVFGPHVRGFDVDAGAVRPMRAISFFAFSTLKYGCDVAAGDLDGDGRRELLTAPGPGPIFTAQVRAFTVLSGGVAQLPGTSFVAFGNASHGARVAGGDVDADGDGDVVAATGPGPSNASQFRAFAYASPGVSQLPGFDATRFPTLYGGSPAAGDVTGEGRASLVASPGPDPASTTAIETHAYDGAYLRLVYGTFDAFPAERYGVNAAAGVYEP